ncbi:hypothetical protein SESBI_46515 [Sesbania bispinosa]|nr:hypothetical protein SESBI_46515 [Sesbania bispinosa]
MAVRRPRSWWLARRGQGAWTVRRTAMGEKKGFASAACERWRCGRTEGDNNDEGECLTVVSGVSRTCWWWTMIGKGWTRIARGGGGEAAQLAGCCGTTAVDEEDRRKHNRERLDGSEQRRSLRSPATSGDCEFFWFYFSHFYYSYSSKF